MPHTVSLCFITYQTKQIDSHDGKKSKKTSTIKREDPNIQQRKGSKKWQAMTFFFMFHLHIK